MFPSQVTGGKTEAEAGHWLVKDPQGLFLSGTAASLPEDASIFALRRCHTCKSPARSCSPLGAASSTPRGCLFLDGVTRTGTRVTEEKNDQSQGSHRRRFVLLALALESQWAHCPEHLSHLPMTVTSAALGSRAPGSLGSLGRSQLPEADDTPVGGIVLAPRGPCLRGAAPLLPGPPMCSASSVRSLLPGRRRQARSGRRAAAPAGLRPGTQCPRRNTLPPPQRRLP